MHAEQLQAKLARLLVEGVRDLLVVELEAVAGAARVGVAVPLPRVDAVGLDLALHLFEERREIWGVFRAIPVVIGSTIPLAQGPLAAGQVIDIYSNE